MKFAEVNPETLEIVDVYNNSCLESQVSDTLIRIPDDLNYQCIEAYRDESNKIMLRHVSNVEFINTITQLNFESLRIKRNELLKNCDWVTLKCYSKGEPVPDEWKVYMQALRDLPANTTDPENPVWPTPPN
jgi:hypothetical protein